MSTITLVRHGQANTSAQDEHSYDNLSDLGHQQARWLGEHLTQTGEHFERVYCGTLRRHLQTANGMQAEARAPIQQDPRLNEMEFFTLANLLRDQQGVAMPDSREGFVTYMPLLLAKWEAGEIENPPETFATFEFRVAEVLAEINDGRGPALVVTSGGLIGMAFRQAMGMDIHAFSRTCIAIMNTSVHRLHRLGDDLSMTQFNAIPHLDRADRQFAQTHL
ncbi:histidine phosphatase family protein [Thalassovita sp.]|uniref:histidine phosphatase family protein n=1 Tax=Thalassovita sp. TaxID=1979401 RepID=UPI002B26B6B8|nr:histidine phosphatase family protein [Thalassovita sp.]